MPAYATMLSISIMLKIMPAESAKAKLRESEPKANVHTHCSNVNCGIRTMEILLCKL